jgi:chaperonin GroEL
MVDMVGAGIIDPTKVVRTALENAASVAGMLLLTDATVTEVDEEKKARVEDAMHATKAAVEEGIVPGGGVALLRSSKAIDGLKLEGDQKVGADIVRRAVEAPLRNIATNAGVEGSIVVQNVKASKDGNYGYNAASDQYEDLVKAGVIDPTKVVRSALQNSTSIAALLLTTEAMVSEIPEEKKEAQAPGGPGGMGGMY